MAIQPQPLTRVEIVRAAFFPMLERIDDEEMLRRVARLERKLDDLREIEFLDYRYRLEPADGGDEVAQC